MKRKEKASLKGDKVLRILSPIGETPSEDKELNERLAKLGADATISQVFREISIWEETAIQKDRRHENTEKTGRLVITCR